MRLIDIVNGPWAITPEMLGEIQNIYRAHVRGPKIDIEAVESRLGRPLKNEPKGYDVIDGVAVLPIDGAISQRMNLFSQISGGTSSDLIKRDLAAALEDPTVRGIVAAISSPGGTVSGTAELADFIRSQRGRKPMYAWTDGQMASAAYWIGSAFDQVYISSDTTLVGSIGVVAKHIDTSESEAKAGVKVTEITSGKYKRIASEHAPLTAEGLADIQSKTDYLYSAFVNDVAQNRNVSVEDVLSRMADGRVFVGRQAIDAGLVDGVSTLEELIARINQPKAPAGVARAAEKGTKIMTLEQLRADHPDLVAALVAEATEGMISATDLQAQIVTARTEGAEQERARIQSVEEQLIPGHEALIASLKFDGKTTGDQAASAIVSAEKGARVAALKAIESGASPAVPAAEPGNGSGVDPSAPIEDRAQAEWDKDSNLRAEFGNRFESYLAYRKNSETGRARILGKK
ncbi:signal peptide peptidase SppA [Desulfuromonas sp. KJ2020]|uniref:signal peptide peptidase SppA n=1 Tax=Desulfuromonas sp. KJ2020 TaxID=2919173 RepID=UPI0020A717CD|nr:signal peptide peptidase SppA [Desulfuromonas sp. KJ2020]MCP3177297.1 signal peptide peptidase SppA [Desulfuromonas sp. KJ2020]